MNTKKVLFLILIISFCAPLKQDLDATKPAGAIARLWPVFFTRAKASDAKALKDYQLTSTNSTGIIIGKKLI